MLTLAGTASESSAARATHSVPVESSSCQHSLQIRLSIVLVYSPRSLRHAEHAASPAVAVNFPTSQGWQAVDPLGLDHPAGHTAQLEVLLVAAVPAGQVSGLHATPRPVAACVQFNTAPSGMRICVVPVASA